VTPILFVVFPLVVVLGVLIVKINVGAHYAPQAYYRRKRGGAPVAFGFDSLGPRPRRLPPGYAPDGRPLDSERAD
jgi:hypothetical protein